MKKQMKCKFMKTCKYYQQNSNTCNKTGGFYMAYNKPAGCYRTNEEIESLKDGLRILNESPVTHSGSIKIMEQRLKMLTDGE